ncbi:DNA-3-methyladenine glycosylase family protein [Nocardioides sp. GXQ0305]|uniref:DNA-3-methyladenine glycosylase family protein n=1 Tax=Nocardioides sp. GXQ0305 TaxID=3423912 RepID=UPI003D7D9DE8
MDSLSDLAGPRGRTRLWEPSWPVPVGAVMSQQRHGGSDPTYKVDFQGRHWRGLRTPEGEATLMVESQLRDGAVYAAAWGEGADWALESVPGLLGADDDPSGFVAHHQVIADVWRHHRDWRIGRSGLVMEALVPAIIEQKVTGQEAFAGFRNLVHRWGNRAPGPGHDLGVWVQPDPQTLRGIPSWEWLKLHIDPARSKAVVMAARVAHAIERTLTMAPDEADRALQSLPGIGRWTSAEVRQRAMGDPDAVSFGDYHVAKDIGWALTGAAFDDDELEQCLEPYRPHRGRVQHLVALAGLHRPRLGPRMAPRTHLPA